MFDHFDYSICLEDKEEEECLNDGLDVFDENSSNKYMKYGDELLIDIVRSRPYLYDKTVQNYKDTKMKENAWREIASVLNITVTECKNRWISLRQRFSKERQLREQEMRSGAEKSTRSKWVLFDSLAFLAKHISQRRSFSNVNFTKSFEPSSINRTSLKTQASTILQNDHEISANDNSNHKPSTSTSGEQPQHILSKKICNTSSNMSIHKNQSNLYSELHDSQSLSSTPLATTEENLSPSTSSRQLSVSDMEESERISPPLSCFSGNQQRAFKKRKIDPMETAFHKMNSTQSTMAAEMCSQKTLVNENTDVLIGKLITAELQRSTEPHKSELKRKFMELLYF